MKKKKILLFTALVVTLGLLGQKNDTLVIGSKLVTEAIQPETGKYLLYWELPNDKYRHVALETRTIEQLSFNGKSVWAFIQKYQTDKGTDADTTFFDATTLQPIAYRTNIASEGYREIIDFMPETLHTTIVYKDSTSSNVKKIPYRYLNAPMMDYLISKLPLSEGYSVVYASLNPGKNHYEHYTGISVIGTESLQMTKTNTIACWKISVDHGRSKSILWYSKKDNSFIKSKYTSQQYGSFIKTRLY